VPTYLLHRATRWSLRRRLDSAERSLAELRAIDTTAVPASQAAPSPLVPGTVGDGIAPIPMPNAFSPPPGQSSTPVVTG
jgi:putative membrane protein